ncbi:hypothetical protein CsSME_00028866 [Camellia sinensis var. sinensis]
MKDLAKKDVEREPKSALDENKYYEGHEVVIGHDRVLLPSQPELDIGRDGELPPKMLKFFRGIHPLPKHTHDIR